MSKKTLVALVGLAAFFGLTPRTVSAHVLKTDGSIGAVIHVSPDDDPVARTSTDFFFDIKDKSSKFSPDTCDCKAAIIQGGKEIYSAPLFQNSNGPSLDSASFSFTFPEKDVYKVQISGKPTTPNAFQPFTLSWDLRVAKEANAATGNQQTTSSSNGFVGWVLSHIPHIIGAGLIIIFVIFALITQSATKKHA